MLLSAVSSPSITILLALPSDGSSRSLEQEETMIRISAPRNSLNVVMMSELKTVTNGGNKSEYAYAGKAKDTILILIEVDTYDVLIAIRIEEAQCPYTLYPLAPLSAEI